MSVNPKQLPVNQEASVYKRYAEAAQAMQPALCCAVDYPADFLSVIPQEVLEKDYGCGDPTRYASEGEVIVDLGSGGGKLCYILAQVVGPSGRVIGVDCNREMLSLARRHQQTVADPYVGCDACRAERPGLDLFRSALTMEEDPDDS